MFESLHPQPIPQSTSAQASAPLCVCLTYIGDNGDCPVHGSPSKCACGRPAASGSSQCAGCRDISQFAAMVGGAR
jgi:hypothetical protein